MVFEKINKVDRCLDMFGMEEVLIRTQIEMVKMLHNKERERSNGDLPDRKQRVEIFMLDWWRF